MTAVVQPVAPAIRSDSRRAWLLPLLCALVAIATYACSLRGTYLIDDVDSVAKDPRLINGEWRALWTTPYRVVDCFDRLYRPLTCTTFALQWQLHGNRPWAFHAVNVLLHGAVTWVLVLLVRRATGSDPAALIAGLLFAVLPIHTEAVVNIVGRAELLCALGTLWGLYTFLGRPLDIRLMVTLAGCFLFAAFSKEQGMLFPLLLLAAVPLRNAQGLPAATPKMRRLFVAVFLWLLATYLIFREHVAPMYWDRSQMPWDWNPVIRAHGLDRVLVPIVIFARYVQVTVVPLTLSWDYSGLVIGYHIAWSNPFLYVGLACAILLAVVGIWSVRRKRWSAFLAICGIVLTYGLVSNTFVVIGTIMGERLAYLPSAFFLMLVAPPLARLWRPALVAGMALIVSLYAVRSVTYAVLWNDAGAFCEYNLAHQPRGCFVYNSMYFYDMDHGQPEAALRVARRLRDFMPDAAAANYIVVEGELATGRYADAERSVEFAYRQGLTPAEVDPLKRMGWEVHCKLLAQPQTRPAPLTPARRQRPGERAAGTAP